MIKTYGADISSYQGTPDFDKIKTQKDFVLIRATEGVGFKDGQFERNRNEARRVGLICGFYHEVYHGNSPEAEADWFVSVVNDLRKDEILAVVWGDYDTSDVDGGQWIGAFADRVAQKYNGYRPMFYSNLGLINNANWAEVWQNRDMGLWLAYPDGNEEIITTQWPILAIKQYSWTGNVNGVDGAVDLNVFYGDKEALKKYGYQPPVVEPPKPIEPKPEKPTIQYQVLVTHNLVTLFESKYSNEEEAKKVYEEKLSKLDIGDSITLNKRISTMDSTDVIILSHYIKPMTEVKPEPILHPVITSKDSIVGAFGFGGSTAALAGLWLTDFAQANQTMIANKPIQFYGSIVLVFTAVNVSLALGKKLLKLANLIIDKQLQKYS